MNFKCKNRILIIIALLFLLSSVVDPIISVLKYVKADETNSDAEDWRVDDKVKEDPDKAQEKASKKKKDFLKALEDDGYSGDVEDYGKKLNEQEFIKSKTYDVPWYMQYLFGPGHYIEDVDKGTKVEGEGDYFDESLFSKPYGKKTACYWAGDFGQNLLYHNCDVPSFGTELFQNMFRNRYPTGVQGGQKTASKSNFGLPVGIENGVPVEPEARGSKFSALELYGYDLPYTVYNGEWDDIQVSSEARLLSNVGLFSKVRILGAGIWNGAKNLLNLVTSGYIFSPSKWIRKSPGFTDGVVSTVVDSADMYVIGTRQWKRPYFTDTLYNAYYMSDMDIINKSQEDLKKFLATQFYLKARTHPRLEKVIKFAPISDEGLYEGDGLEWSKDERFPRFDYMEYRECLAYERDEEGRQTDVCAIWETEEEAFDRWKKDRPQKDYDKAAHKAGLEQDCFETSKSYSELKRCWVEPWYDYAKPEMSFNQLVVQQIMEVLINAFLMNNPKYDPSQQISHYVQADAQGVPIGGWEDKASWQYLYSSVEGGQAILAPGAKPVRPAIKGSLFGNGESGTDTKDDRYMHFLKVKEDPIGDMSLFAKTFKKISVFFTKVTNELISFSYSNIVEKLKLDKIVNMTVNKLTDSLFFPLSIIMAAISAVFAMARFGQYPRAGINSIVWLFIVFMIGAVLLSNPGKVIKTIEEVPTAIDNALAEIILLEDETDAICSTTGGSSSVRSVQCTVWKLGVFTPWLEGQWGVTDYKQLDSNNLSNKNRNLVGDAEVNMGGGVIEHNWAIYQLENMKSGTITTNNPKDLEGVTSKALYQIVDLQVGPKNSAKSDGTYFSSWSGMNMSYRNIIQLLSMLVSIMMVLTIGGFSIYKIEITMLALIKFLLMPIHMLKNMGPNSKQKFLRYMNEWFALFLRRVFIGLFMIVVLSVFQATTKANTKYTILSIFLIMFMLTIRIYFREILDMIASTTNSIEGKLGNYKSRASQVDIAPKSVKQMTRRTATGVKEGAIGAVSGAIVGAGYSMGNAIKGIDDGSNVLDAVKKGWDAGYGRGSLPEQRRARKAGYGMMMNMAMSAEAARRKELVKKDLSNFKEDTIEDAINGKINFQITAKMNRKAYLEYTVQEGWSSDEEEKMKAIFSEIDELNEEISNLKEAQYKLNEYKKKKSGNVQFADIASKYNKYYDIEENNDRIEAIYNSIIEERVNNISKQYSKRTSEFDQEAFNREIDDSVQLLLDMNNDSRSMSGAFTKPAKSGFARARDTAKANIEMQAFSVKEALKDDSRIITEEYNEDLYNYYSKLLDETKLDKDDVEFWAAKKNIEISAKESKKKLEDTKKKILLNALEVESLEDELNKDNDIFNINIEDTLFDDVDELDTYNKEKRRPVIIEDKAEQFKEAENIIERMKGKEDLSEEDYKDSSDKPEENTKGDKSQKVKEKKFIEFKKRLDKSKDNKEKIFEEIEKESMLEDEQLEKAQEDIEKEIEENKASKESLEDNSKKNNSNLEDSYSRIILNRAEQRRLQMELEIRQEIVDEIEETKNVNKSIIDRLNETTKVEKYDTKDKKEITEEEKKEVIKKGMIVESILEKEDSINKIKLNKTKPEKPKIENYKNRADELRAERKKRFMESIQDKYEVDLSNKDYKSKDDIKNSIYEEIDKEDKAKEKKNFNKKTDDNVDNRYKAEKNRANKFKNKLKNLSENNNKGGGNDD